MLLIILMDLRDMSDMRAPGRPQPRGYLFIVVIFVGILIDAVLFAQVHANFIHDHGYDLHLRHPAVAKPAPP
ncbi:MAG: hypothetical protein WAU82_02790 [Candidatus Binatus sp.]|uniref:hypothetical protein n=1 Tax=Candidatus Binatus sp. TaxID=2811406 RepID=UPI003BAF1C57